jgi:hypothetical protein
MVNVWWDAAELSAPFDSFSMDITISRDMPSDRFNLYISPMSGAFSGDASFYGGLQTNIGGYPAAHPDDRAAPYHKGKGAIFSRWGKGLDLTYVRAEADGLVEAAGYEGDFVSGRRPLSWKAGTYAFELRRMSVQRREGRDWTWIAASVVDRASGRTVRVASLRFPGNDPRLKPQFGSFIEFYGGKDVDIAGLPPLEVRFGRPAFNGRPLKLDRVSVRYPDGPNEPASPPIMDAALSEDGTQVVCRLHNGLLTDRAAGTLLPR